ncbi:hypothetical protein [uncultured Parasphingopyxis sp.]|uniref:hypothetical protein n=1 Tax=uncultured Parasphingopyxis sp. TaxID=1547918 RepID=UPI002638E0F9|nr:hypothetical protein [uncultured Parasphingopyxis sp.]
MIRSTLSAALAATLLLAGCSDDTVQPSDGPDIVASPVEGADDPAIELLTGEPDVGQWFYNADVTEDYGPRATFGQPNTDGVFTLACDGATGELVLSRAGALPSDDATEMRVVAESGQSRYTARASEGELPRIEARMALDDPFVETLAFIAEPFGILVEGAEPLLMPAPDDNLSRVIETCRGRAS